MKFSNKSIVLGLVSDSTGVDDYILMEDDGFTDLLYKNANNVDVFEFADILIEYVNNNY